MAGAGEHGGDSFGALLRRYRLRAGLSHEALAERAGLSLRGVSDLERGARRAPHPNTRQHLAEALTLEGAEREELPARSADDRSWFDTFGPDGAAACQPHELHRART